MASASVSVRHRSKYSQICRVFATSVVSNDVCGECVYAGDVTRSRTPWLLSLAAGALALGVGCSGGSSQGGEGQRAGTPVVSEAASAKSQSPPRDDERSQCQKRIAAVEELAALPGAPEFEKNRVGILGRAKGEPVVWLEEPPRTPVAPELPKNITTMLEVLKRKPKRTPGKFDHLNRLNRLTRLLSGHKAALRAEVLRSGYIYSSDPHEAFALVRTLSLVELFDEDTVYLLRGSSVHELQRKGAKRGTRYVFVDGELEGQQAFLLLGDRVGLSESELAVPLHIDLISLAHREGFDRARLTKLTAQGVVAELRFGSRWYKSLLSVDDARAQLECVDAPREQREELWSWQRAQSARRAALARVRAAVTTQVGERLRFDKPRGAEGPDRDGELRWAWRSAYRRGQSYFSVDEVSYPVFDSRGRPFPPQVCVDFVLESFERASGTWYTPQNAKPERVAGSLDFNSFDIDNRRGVLGLEKFAEETPDVFTHHRFEDERRIKFREREAFFANLLDYSERVRAGDILAIRGLKRDGRVHQHAILVETTDPITGFPHGLADQMNVPRRRTWEDIMAEAPLRALYYHLRLKDDVFERIAKKAPAVAAAAHAD